MAKAQTQVKPTNPAMGQGEWWNRDVSAKEALRGITPINDYDKNQGADLNMEEIRRLALLHHNVSTPTPTPTPTPPPTRTPDPLPPTFAAAVKSLGPGPFGDTTFGQLIENGRWIGTPNNSGFTELTPEMQQEIAGLWSNDMMSPINVVPYDKSIFEGTPVAFSSSEDLPAGVGFNTDVDLNSGLYDTVLSQSQPMTGLQALRADERSKGLIYASGKYWADNADGKLEAIPTDLVDGEGTARQQAIAFMESKMQPIVEQLQKEEQMDVNPNIFDSSEGLPEEVGFNTDVDLNIGTNNFSSIDLPGSIDPSVWKKGQKGQEWQEMSKGLEEERLW